MLTSDSQGSDLPFKKRLDNFYFLLKILHLFSLDLRVKYELTLQSILSVSSVQFSHSVVSDFLRPHESQHARPPCPSPTPGVHSDSSPSSQWCHPAISSSGVPFSSCPQSLPASVFSHESALSMRWPKYWSFSFSIILSKEIPGLISFRMDWLDVWTMLVPSSVIFFYSVYFRLLFFTSLTLTWFH